MNGTFFSLNFFFMEIFSSQLESSDLKLSQTCALNCTDARMYLRAIQCMLSRLTLISTTPQGPTKTQVQLHKRSRSENCICQHWTDALKNRDFLALSNRNYLQQNRVALSTLQLCDQQNYRHAIVDRTHSVSLTKCTDLISSTEQTCTVALINRTHQQSNEVCT